MKRNYLYFASLSLAAMYGGGAQAQQHPNVIIIYADDLGYGDLECYGDQNVATPQINRLAAEGCRFTNAFAVVFINT